MFFSHKATSFPNGDLKGSKIRANVACKYLSTVLDTDPEAVFESRYTPNSFSSLVFGLPFPTRAPPPPPPAPLLIVFLSLARMRYFRAPSAKSNTRHKVASIYYRSSPPPSLYHSRKGRKKERRGKKHFD